MRGPRPREGITLKEATVGPLQLYEVKVNGYTTRMRLTEGDAERMGGVPVGSTGMAAAEPVEEQAPQVKKRAPRNKSRTAANKAS